MVAAHLAQELRRQGMRFKKIEHLGRAVVTRGIVRCTGKASRTLTVDDPSVGVAFGQRVELTEPSGDDRAQVAISGKAKKAVAFAQLAVLVAATHNERTLQPLSGQGKWNRVERMVRIHEKLSAHLLAGLRSSIRGGIGGSLQDGKSLAIMIEAEQAQKYLV